MSRIVKANQDWTTLALHYPLKYKSISVHVVGVHHHSQYSIDRVRTVLQTLKPAAVLIELNQQTLGFVLSKQSFLASERAKVIQTASKTQLTESQLQSLQLYGIRPSDVQEDILYAAEMGEAIKEAQKLKSRIEYVDESVNDLLYMMKYDSEDNIAKDAQSRFRLYHHRYRSYPSFFGTMLYHLFSFYVFRGKSITKAIDEDYAGIGDHYTHLQLWKRFHPSMWYWTVGLRDSVMTERAFRVCQQLENANDTSNDSLQLDRKKIVLVVGKTHYFGIKEFWDRFIEKSNKIP